jgi:Sporulation and spore germination
MKKLLLGLLGLLVVGIAAGYGIGWYLHHSQQKVERIPIVVEPEQPPREVQLYFADPQGRYLVPELRQIPGCDADQDCMRSLVEALRSGSQQGNLPVLPKSANLIGVELENDLVRLNFSRQLIDHHPGGTLSELLTVYSLANSLVENFSYLRQVQILIDGQIQQTLKGHVRIDQPVFADFSYNRPPLAGPVPVDESQEGKPQTVPDEATPPDTR